MWLPTLLPLAVLSSLLPTTLSQQTQQPLALPPTPLRTSSRWILNAEGTRVKLRCVNWAAHMEPNTPEGLQHQPLSTIISHITSLPFNCVRLTYSIDLALAPEIPTEESFSQAAERAGVDRAALMSQHAAAVQKNPWLANATRIEVLDTVVSALGDAGLMVLLDNHVSRAGWCCDLSDGNGWWADAPGYADSTSRYFNTDEWLRGLTAMSAWAAERHPRTVVAMGLRNEIRGIPLFQDTPDRRAWFERIPRAIDAVLGANPNVLAVVGGTYGGTDASFLRSRPLDRSRYPDRVVWEYHVYSYSIGYATQNCDMFTAQMGAAAGFLLEQGRDFTGPLWVSEFGFGMAGGEFEGGLNEQDWNYFRCLRGYLEGNDAEWAHWALQGDYYVRQGQLALDEGYGLLNRDWSGFRHPDPKALFGGLWEVTQGP